MDRLTRPWDARLLRELQDRIGYSFKDAALAERAFTHRSLERSSSTLQPDYETLEFLGDSILGFVISETLFSRHGECGEGTLSKMRAYLVSRRHLARIARQLGLGHFVRLGAGEEKTGGRDKPALLADLFESLVAAIYLDGGLARARTFIVKVLGPSLASLEKGDLPSHDFKSRLQERLHQQGQLPAYRVLQEEGPPHQRRFLVEVSAAGQALGRGWGSSKKEAEQQAAFQALESLVAASPPQPDHR